MNEQLSFPKRPFKTFGGISLMHQKRTAKEGSVVMPPPDSVSIPMQQHIGAPCSPCVSVGEHVLVGQKIGDSSAPVSAPVHASVSGTVKEIGKIITTNGGFSECVVIESDGKMEEAVFTPPHVETQSELIDAVRQSGLVGLGGAGFPAHVKLNVPADKKIDTLLINAAECEPYLTADHSEILENSWQVMSGIYAVKEILGIKRVIIGVEGNKPDAIEILRKIAYNEKYDANNEVRILELKQRYPQGAEKILIRSCTGRKIAPGKLPSDVGCIVMNVTSIAFLADYLKTGKPLVSKRVTVEGNAVTKPQNVIVPIGTRLGDVIEFCGGCTSEPKKIICGGPMMGTAMLSPDMVVLKNTNGILVLNEADATLPKETSCIRCGKCVDACPMSLSPLMLAKAVERKDVEALKKLNIMTCMECGCCAYGCPAKRHLVQTMRLGKILVKERKQ